MPYQLESPFGAALDAAGGYAAGVAAKKQRQTEADRQARLDAQAQADTAARLGLAQSNATATNEYRKAQLGNEQTRLGIEKANSDRETAATAAADAQRAEQAKRQKLVDLFQSQGIHYPKNWTTMKPEQKIAYLQVRLNAAQKAGDQKTVSNTETEINRVATEAEQARRDAALAKQRDTQNSMGQQRISISLDRLGQSSARTAAAAGDPQALADVSGRLARAKTRDQAQAVLDSPEGSLLNDRQYNRLQKQVDETYGTHEQVHKPAAKPTATQQRDELYNQASKSIADGKDRDSVVKRYAAMKGITVDRADAELPDAP